MSWTLMFPATASVVTVIALTLALRSLEREAILLRASLRRVVATAVATDELSRRANDVRLRAERTRADASSRLAIGPRRWLVSERRR